MRVALLLCIARTVGAQTGACYATSEHPSSYALNTCPTLSESACKADSGPHNNCVWCPYLAYHPQGGDCSAWCQGNDSRCRKVENTYEGCLVRSAPARTHAARLHARRGAPPRAPAPPPAALSRSPRLRALRTSRPIASIAAPDASSR